jgi:hypothetical protein
VAILRAFVWLRWRMLVNAFERTSARDTLERLSLAVENVGPIIALLLLIPSAAGMALLGGVAGFGLGTSAWQLPFEVLRYLMFAALGFAVVGPIVLPAADASSPIRFLLLPVPRAMLYMAQLAGTLADPWNLLTVPVVLGVAGGLLVGGHVVASAIALVAGAAFVAILAGITSLTSSIVHLLLRNRRRGDVVMLLLVLLLPMLGLLPEVLRPERHADRSRERPRAEHVIRAPTALDRATRKVAAFLPSELYRQADIAAVRQATAAGKPLGILIVLAAGLQLIGFAAYNRVLDMPQTLGVRRGSAFGGLWSRRIPGLTPGASAVALTQLRLALRTTRGRSILISPLMLLVFFGTLLYRRGGLPLAGMTLRDGLLLGTFASFIAMFASMPIAANQFAVDGAGFTRQMLSPLSIGELLAGKAVGNALISAGPALICVLVAAGAFGGGDPVLWLTLLPAWIATYAMVAPAVAVLSAIFPREVDLSRIGNGSNAHQAAGLLSVLALAAGSVPSVLLVLLATRVLHRPALALLFTSGWCLLALAISWFAFVPVRRLVSSRTETLAQYY